MSTLDHAKALNALLRSIKSRYEPAEPPHRSPLEELVHGFLLYDCTLQKADAAFKRLMSHVVDLNELRVCRASEISGVLGKTYPMGDERSQRLKATLQEVYLREFAVSLDKCAEMAKRDGRKYLESLDGMLPFVAARVVLLRLGGHAIPVDDKLLARLVEAGVLEPGLDPARAEGILERHIKADDALRIHLLLQAWSDDAGAETKKPRGGRAPGSKKTAARRAARTRS